MLTEIEDFLKNFQGKILHGMNTVQWQGFYRGWRFSCDYFPGIYQNRFWGISLNTFRGISHNLIWEISHNLIWEISHNQFQGILSYPFLTITGENDDQIWRNYLEFLEISSSEPIPGNFLGTIPKIFPGVSQKYLEIF